MEPIVRSKATSAKSFLMLLDYRKKSSKVNTRQREEQFLPMFADGKAQANFFIWPPLTPKR